MGGTVRIVMLLASCTPVGACASNPSAVSSETESCALGSEGCACTAGGSCDMGLICASSLCVSPTSSTTSGNSTSGDSSHDDSTAASTADGTDDADSSASISASGTETTDGGDPGAVVDVATGSAHTCGIGFAGNVRCWGHGAFGALGYANTNDIGNDETPASAGDVDVGGIVVQVAAGNSHTCARLDTGDVRCWGHGDHGQLGYGNIDNIGDDEAPATAGDVDVGGTVVQIEAGMFFSCALLDTGDVRCWGDGTYGKLGYGNTANVGDSETPASAGDVDVGGTVIQIAAGSDHTCALLDAGNVRCWGSGDAGQLGYGNTTDIGDGETPASAGNVSVGGTVVQVAADGVHTCALLDTGNVRCWGGANSGQLGYGTVDFIGDDETPATAGDVDVGGSVVQIETGSGHTCALLGAGNVRCWGYGPYLGYGNEVWIGDDEVPSSAGDVDVGGPVTRLASSLATCALLDTGNLRCWGPGIYGVLGYGNSDDIGDDETPASAGDVPF